MDENEVLTDNIEQTANISENMDEKLEYSDYFKCDLHIHTDESKKTKKNDYKGTFSVKDIIDKITSPEHDVKMFSFTDHNIINVSAYEEYYKDYDTTDRCLLVGIELDIILEEYLFDRIEYSIKDQSYNKESFHSLVIFKSKDAKSLNKKLNEMYKKISLDYKTKKNQDIDLNSTNLKNRYTSFDRLSNAFKKDDYLIISHGNKSANIVKAYESYKNGLTEAQVMVILGVVNSVEMVPGNNAKIINNYNIGFQKLLTEDFSAKKEVPYVVFSDNHQIEAYPKKDSNQTIEKNEYTWIKGDLSFETLRMAFVDPLSRIIISSNKPSVPNQYLEQVSFKTLNNGNPIEHTIDLSPGINTIVGGRSSGKSLLFNAILNTLASGKEKSKINDYTKKNNVLVDEETIKSKMNCNTEFSNNNICELHAFTQEGIIEKFENNGIGLKDELDFPKLDSEELNSKISDYSKCIDNFINSYSDLISTKNNYQSNISISTFINSSKELKEKYVVASIIETLKNQNSYNLLDIETIIKKFKDELVNVGNLKVLKLNDELIIRDEEIEIVEQYEKLLNNKLNYYIDLYKKVYVLNQFIHHLNEDLNEISNKYKSNEMLKIANAKRLIQNETVKFYNYFKNGVKFKKYANELELRKIIIDEKNKKINDNYTLNTKVDNTIDSNFLVKLFTDKISDYDTKLSISNNFENLLNGKLKVKYKDNSVESVIYVFNYVKNTITETLAPKYSIIEKGSSINVSSDNMSQGKKASIYLEIILEQCKSDESIIMIDQPEDNIDNKFITDILIDKIRELRMKNQIILVTHNAAIAINSDSENIIVADNDEGDITYETGGLEKIEHRKNVCKLLDGGNYIFDNRYHKYNIINNKIGEPIRKDEENE